MRMTEYEKDIQINIGLILSAFITFLTTLATLTNADMLFKEKRLNMFVVLDSNGDFAGILDIREM